MSAVPSSREAVPPGRFIPFSRSDLIDLLDSLDRVPADDGMRWVDRLLIGIPASISGIIIASTKLLTTIGLLVLVAGFYLGVRDEPVVLDQATLIALGAGLGSFGGYLTRQFTKFKARRMEFLKTLADNLYFRNLDNDAGVFHNLLDAAEEEETKEAILGWYFLRSADRPLPLEELDRIIEAWFAEHLDCVLDFEVTDGIDKLRRLELVAGDELARHGRERCNVQGWGA